jgi:hypothetical protein
MYYSYRPNRITKPKMPEFPPQPLTKVKPAGSHPSGYVALAENLGLNAPFQTFSWVDWLQMQTNIICALSRFQRAIEHGKVDVAHLSVIDIYQALEFLCDEVNHARAKQSSANDQL